MSRALTLALSLLLALPVSALSVDEALESAAKNNPSLQATRTEERRASLQLSAEEARFPWVLSARLAPAITQNPSLNSLGATNSSYSESLDLTGGLRKPFSTGTQLNFEVGGSASRQRAPVLPTQDEPLLLGPGYGLLARLSLSHPFLRGGRESVEAPMRTARLRAESADAATRTAASETSRDVLLAYWELWYAVQSVEIDELSLQIARRSLDEALARIEEGSLAEVERYSFDLRIATLEESLSSARVEVTRRQLELARLTGVEKVSTAIEAPRDFDPLPANVSELALSASPQIAQLETEVALAENSVRSALDATRPRLDVEAALTSRGLGNKEILPAVDGVFGTDGLSGSIVLTYEQPLSREAVRADENAARLSVESAQWRLQAQRDSIRAEVRTLGERRDNARRQIALAEKTVAIAEKQVLAEQERLELGASIALQVLEAESSLRSARLRLARARADLTSAQLSLLHLSGELVSRVLR